MFADLNGALFPRTSDMALVVTYEPEKPTKIQSPDNFVKKDNKVGKIDGRFDPG